MRENCLNKRELGEKEGSGQSMKDSKHLPREENLLDSDKQIKPGASSPGYRTRCVER